MNELFPKVTALIPSYNHGRYIRERILSVVEQTYKNIELIIIDDCSSDDTHKIIIELQNDYDFQLLNNDRNSGTPFSAWERICKLANGAYIWVCESDDIAEPCFLENAVKSLREEPEAVMFYSSSVIINEENITIDHTDTYFHKIWKEQRWDNDFTVDGNTELKQYQMRGQTLPNMSSALFTADSFRKAYAPFLKNFKLTGDWLFVGNIMKLGKVVYHHADLSRYRKHKVTARAQVASARSQAEFMLTKYHLFIRSGSSLSSFAILMGTDAVRFLYEPDTWRDVIKELFKISWIDTLKFGSIFFIATFFHPGLIKKFLDKSVHAKEWRRNEEANNS